jgi:hypothetical protein
VIGTIDFLVVDVLPVITIGLEGQACSTNVAFETAMMEECGVLERADLIRWIDRLSTAKACFLDHLKRGEAFKQEF